MPLHGIYNNYELRLLQIKKLNRKFSNKICKYYKNVYEKNLELERLALKNRLIELNGEDLRNLTSEEFDENIKGVIENFTIFDERDIKSDFSYNLAHFDEYRNYAKSHYNL